MRVKQDLIDTLIRRHGLIQAASNPDRPAYHVASPSGRRKAVLTDIRVAEGGVVSGYVWLTSLPDRGSALLRRRPDLTPVGTDGACLRVQDVGAGDLPGVVQEIVDHLT